MAAETILNVDDYLPARHARTKLLAHAGFNVTEAGTGAEALRLAAERRPQLIVLDVNLPDISGLEVCRRIKSDPNTSGIMVLHLSASNVLDRHRVAGLDAGADNYLIEPIDPAVLIASIHALLRTYQAEEALRRSNAELQHFAYMISHELSEPLRGITAFTQLAHKRFQENLDAEAKSYMEQAMAGANRMKMFLDDMLAFSVNTSPDRRFAPVSLNSILATVLFELQPAIEAAGAVVTSDPLPDILGNSTRLSMVFKNLIGNAIKYRGKQPPRVHVSAAGDGAEWVISVRDNGVGIDPKYRERIFEIFRRLHSREIPGSGIGLALCKRIVENHGGRIWVESQLGYGSTFFFTVPAAPASAEAASIQ